MKRLVVVGLFAILLAVIGYTQFAPKPSTPRDGIEKSVRELSTTKKLSADEQQLLRLQLAVVDYISNHQAPPDSLTQLVPIYFDAVPVDPATKTEFKYVRDGNKYFLGEQVDERNGTAPAALAKNEKAGITNSGLKLNVDGFVNPNEMVQDDFVYDPAGKRDPFMPFDLSGGPSKGSGLLTPLENYSLGQLRLTAVLSADGVPTAIVEDSVGKGYTVRSGTKIGNNGGVIVAIENDRLKILETKLDFTGKEVQNIAELVIQKDSPSSDPKDAQRRKAADAKKRKEARKNR